MPIRIWDTFVSASNTFAMGIHYAADNGASVMVGDYAPAKAAQVFSGLGVGSNLPVSTCFRSANTAQFGGKSSLSMEGATGSQNTGKVGGAAGMVISAARDAGLELRPDETRVILERGMLEHYSAHDGLNGLLNRRGAEDAARRALWQAVRDRVGFGLAVSTWIISRATTMPTGIRAATCSSSGWPTCFGIAWAVPRIASAGSAARSS